MNSIRTFLLALALFLSLTVPARIKTDTLCSAHGDMVIITYETTQQDNKVELRFRSIRKNFGDALRRKYGKSSEIKLLFFDRIGVTEDITFTGATPRAFSLPSDIGYTKSLDSYFFIDNQPFPLLSFEMKSAEEKTVSIPIYLAHYEGKRRYEILYLCGNLDIKMGNKMIPYKNNKKESIVQYQGDMGEALSEDDNNALWSLNTAIELLAKQESLPFEDNLIDEYKFLQKQKHKISNEEIIKKIDRFLAEYEATKKSLEKEALAQAQAAQEEAERKADDDAFARCLTKDDYEIYKKTHPDGQHVEEAIAQIKKLEDEAAEEKKQEKKRTIWMIIGGALLAILLFVGNQVFQSFRNIRTQRSMMQMQKDAENRAKNMARSKAQGAIRKQTGKAMNQARQKSKTAVQNAIDKGKNKIGNNNSKRVSI